LNKGKTDSEKSMEVDQKERETQLENIRRGLLLLLYLYSFGIILGRLISVSSEAKKNAILSSLKSITYETKEKCMSVLDECTLKYKVFSALPVNDSSEFNKEIIGAILDILEGVLKKLITVSSTKKEDTAAVSNFSNADGYNTILYILSVYEDKTIRQRISRYSDGYFEGIFNKEVGDVFR
jgi:hypothetical protein